MKVIGIISTATLSLLLGIAVPAYSQQEQQDKPAQQGEKKAQQDRSAKPGERGAQQQDKNAQQGEKKAQPQQTQRAGGNGHGRIPDDRFRANFGREHTFRVSQTDYSRDRRFQYGGYWFGFVDVWPSNWLYTQDVFVVEINGAYYLCNPTYPGVNITLNIVE